jgi:DNA-binding transcriptional ArsR family regulator
MGIVESAFAVIAEPNRRAILSLLTASERSVGEIELSLGMSQPAVSKHLRVLRDSGLVPPPRRPDRPSPCWTIPAAI